MAKKAETSWGGVAKWYDAYLTKEDSYQQQVILPNLLRILSLKNRDRVLDLACGQGFFSQAFAEAGATVVGADIAPELIAFAKQHSSTAIQYHVAPADTLSFAADDSFDIVVCVLAIQNIENMLGVFKEVKRVVQPVGKFVLVVNHPAFRVPKSTSWGWDEETKTQYRRIDSYLSQSRTSIDMHPGSSDSEKTVSYHRSLQDFFKAFAGAGFAVTRVEEWISHKKSEKGPRQEAEDSARKEIPLFLLFEATPK